MSKTRATSGSSGSTNTTPLKTWQGRSVGGKTHGAGASRLRTVISPPLPLHCPQVQQDSPDLVRSGNPMRSKAQDSSEDSNQPGDNNAWPMPLCPKGAVLPERTNGFRVDWPLTQGPCNGSNRTKAKPNSAHPVVPPNLPNQCIFCLKRDRSPSHCCDASCAEP